MACTAAEIVDLSKCLAQGMSERQLLAYIAYQLAVNASVDPTPSNLVSLSKCIAQGLGERQMLSIISYFQCLASP